MTSKKIIAREFLFLLATVLIGTFIALIYEGSCYRYRMKNDEVYSLHKKENIPVRLALFRLVNSEKFSSIDDCYCWDGAEDFISKIKGREGIQIYNEMKLNGYFDISTLDQFQKKVSEDSYSEEYLSLLKLKCSEREEYERLIPSVFDSTETNWGVLFALLFPLRYLIYATIWSIRTIRK
jgi:hypothetical protein